MNAGKLRHVVTVQESVSTQDASGDPVVTWTTLGTLRAEINPKIGRERVFANQILSQAEVPVLLRWSPLGELLTAKHRLVHQGSIFNVSGTAQPFLARREIEVVCTSGVNDG